MTVKEYEDLLWKLTAIEDKAKARGARILNLESHLDEAQAEIDMLKLSVTETKQAMTKMKQSLEFTQGEQEHLAERVTLSENDQSAQWNEIIQQNIHSRRWKLIFYRIQLSPEEDCTAILRSILTERLEILDEAVQHMKSWGIHRLGKLNRSKTRPLIPSPAVQTEIKFGNAAIA